MESTLPLRDQSAPLPAAKADAGVVPNGVPLGMGGAYTLNVSGPYVTYRDPSPSGITLFPGIPVEVTVSGLITREQTAGFINHCALLPAACPPFLKSNTPFGPGGLAFTNLGAATSWWDAYYGLYYYTSPGGSVVYRGLSGTNLLLGRTGLYCTWGHVFSDGTVEQGDCYAMGGGFTYTVHARATPPGQAGLTLAITKNGMGPSGGPVDLTAATTDGSAATNLTWYFIADAVTSTTDPDPNMPVSASLSPASPSMSRSAYDVTTTSGTASFPVKGHRIRAIDARTGDTTITTDIHTLPVGDYLFLAADSMAAGIEAEHAEAGLASPAAAGATRLIPAPAARALAPSGSRSSVGSSDPYPGSLPAPLTGSAALDGCAESLTCSANVHVAGGTFVVTGLVHGTLRVAEQRVAALAEDPSGKKSLYVILDPESDKMLTFERHIPAGNCPATETESPRQLHVFVIDSSTETPTKVPNAHVTLKLSAVVPPDPTQPDAGGHAVAFHTGNPKPPGRLTASEVITDADGDAYVTYHASEWGGKYAVRGESEGAAPGADTITVGIPLIALGGGAHYSLIGDTPAHPSNHFGTAPMIQNLGEFANDMFENENISIELNDLSLPLGGRYEVKDTGDPVLAWSNLAHCDHREGRGTDLRTNTFMPAKYSKKNPSPTVKAMMASWQQLNPNFPAGKLAYFWEGDHLHLKTVH